MTGPDGEGADVDVLRAAPELHRTAVMLTADADAGVDLVAAALAGAREDLPGTGEQVEALRAEVVRAWLRRAPRRSELRTAPRSRDAGEVLAGLSPRARAAAVLRLVHRWDDARTAQVLGVRTNRVPGLAPGGAELGHALEAVADRHALPAAEVAEAVQAALPSAAPARRPGRRGPLLAAAGVLAALLVGYALTQGGTDASSQVDAEVTSPGWDRAPDFAEAGLVLDDEGQPTPRAAGLLRAATTQVDRPGEPVEVEWEARYDDYWPSSVAAYAVLWCDMPPADDEHIVAPSGTLTVDGEALPLPCAGKDGAPPVSGFTAIPSRGHGSLEIAGDLPSGGTAVLGIYAETADGGQAPLSRTRARGAVPPTVPDGAVAVGSDDVALTHDLADVERFARTIEISHDTELQIWAGQTGTVSVAVDGLPATDDGDLARTEDLYAEYDPSASALPEPDDTDSQWRGQDPHVRDGSWVVRLPDDVRSFAVPEAARPAPGERRVVTVEAVTSSLDTQVQVLATAAEPVTVDDSEVARLAPGSAAMADLPRFAQGHELVAGWQVPADSLTHRLDATGLPREVTFVAVADQDVFQHVTYGYAPMWHFFGVVETDGAVGMLPTGPEVTGLDIQTWFAPDSSTGSGGGADTVQTARVSLPAAPEHPPARILAYAPVDYEDFDFVGAPPPEQSYASHSSSYSGEVLQTLTLEDLDDDDQLAVHVGQPGSMLMLRITTVGPGQLRATVEGRPIPGTEPREGWWSSWTDQEVTTTLSTEGGYYGSADEGIEVQIEVDGFTDGLTVEILDGG